MSGEISGLVDAAVGALISREPRAMIESLRALAEHDPSEVYADLCGLIDELAADWIGEFPDEDELGNSGVTVVVGAIRAQHREAFMTVVGEDHGQVVIRLLATAASLTKH